MRTINLLQAKRDEVFELAQCHGVTSIRVFGSDARGAETAEGDVDLLVITGTKVGSGFPSGLLFDPGRLHGRHIDVVTEAGLNALLRDRVLNGAVAL